MCAALLCGEDGAVRRGAAHLRDDRYGRILELLGQRGALQFDAR